MGRLPSATSPDASPPATWRKVVLAIYWSVLFGATHLPATEGSQPLPLLSWVAMFDKAAHFAAYALLACLLAWSIGQHGRRLARRAQVRLWLIVAVYAAADELLQWPVGRSCELSDWLADVAGGAAGLLLARLLPASKTRANSTRQ